MSLTLLTTICGGVTVLILALLAWAFWTDPAKGLEQTTHRLEKLPLVMADRYTAFAVLALVFTIYGDLNVLIALFAVCAFMGFADGLIYARAGHPHMKHTISGVLSSVALAIATAARVTEGAS
ncbi:hypothetical protein [Nioella sp.]|uniref:hypothetical protein n=1 Tax=Nioella sp. TaxID=1912091 RepID=UPI003A899363